MKRVCAVIWLETGKVRSVVEVRRFCRQLVQEGHKEHVAYDEHHHGVEMPVTAGVGKEDEDKESGGDLANARGKKD